MIVFNPGAKTAAMQPAAACEHCLTRTGGLQTGLKLPSLAEEETSGGLLRTTKTRDQAGLPATDEVLHHACAGCLAHHAWAEQPCQRLGQGSSFLTVLPLCHSPDHDGCCSTIVQLFKMTFRDQQQCNCQTKHCSCTYV